MRSVYLQSETLICLHPNYVLDCKYSDSLNLLGLKSNKIVNCLKFISTLHQLPHSKYFTSNISAACYMVSQILKEKITVTLVIFNNGGAHKRSSKKTLLQKKKIKKRFLTLFSVR